MLIHVLLSRCRDYLSKLQTGLARQDLQISHRTARMHSLGDRLQNKCNAHLIMKTSNNMRNSSEHT